MERKFAVRVKWQIGWGGMGSVVMCKDSPDLIAKIEEQLPIAESTFKDIETINIIEEELCAISQSPTIQAFTKDDIEKFAHLDDGILSTLHQRMISLLLLKRLQPKGLLQRNNQLNLSILIVRLHQQDLAN
ncbi:uncharacterized protein LOC123903928 [Trifolium pratense]|uniref:uncharacterized protein LOC123903928 n=1 Tax=Trifolium pratense TaxID=57577 RepID=UPI001E693816|nr:uncharacterized protein LOC123903928 [Trifolium pratense]